LIGRLSASAATYAERITPLLVSPDLENRSGALFNRRGDAVMPSPKLTEEYVERFIAAPRHYSSAPVSMAGGTETFAVFHQQAE
jgi:hypothetical protein